jgi:LacI family transcriptional regulator
MGELERARIPYVVINGRSGPGGCSVAPDDIDGTHIAVRHLTGLGHRRIAYAGPLANHLDQHSSVEDRHQTYLSELVSQGLSPVPGHDVPLESAIEFLKSAVLEYRATAIVAYGHMEGFNLAKAAHTMGISIPEQLSLVSFCDENAVNVISPGLTFVDLRAEHVGRVAAKLLLRQIRSLGQAEPESVKLRERLVLRNSTGPAPKAVRKS